MDDHFVFFVLVEMTQTPRLCLEGRGVVALRTALRLRLGVPSTKEKNLVQDTTTDKSHWRGTSVLVTNRKLSDGPSLHSFNKQHLMQSNELFHIFSLIQPN